MQNTKLVQILFTLDKKELSRFIKFVESPFFNTDTKLVLLTKYLVKNLTKGEKHLDKDLVFKKVFPQTSYTETSKRVMTSNLYKLLRQFIRHSFIGANPYEVEFKGQLRTLDFYLHKGLNDHFEKQLVESKKFQEKYPYKNYRLHFNNFLLSGQEARYLSNKRQTNEALNQLLNDLDTFYTNCKLQLSTLKLTHDQSLGIESKFNFIEEVLRSFNQIEHYQNISSIVLYYHAFLLIRAANNEQHYENYKNVLSQHLPNLEKEEAQNLYVHAINFCSSMIANGKTNYYEELFHIYRIGINTKLIYEKKQKLSIGNLKNIITISISLGKLDWATQFLDDHKEKLASQEPEKIIQYNLAFIAYHQQKYPTALNLLVDKYTDPFYNISAKILRLKIFQATDDIDRLDKTMNSFRVFMSEGRIKGISSRYQESYRNFVNILYRINSINTYKNDERINTLLAEIKSCDPLSQRAWLLEVLEGMR